MICDESVLQTLVGQSIDPSENIDAIVDHLESCARCQQTLADLGGEDGWWKDAKQWLAIPADESDDFNAGAFDSHSLPPIDLSFLETPTHPEMLGRIGRYEVESVLGRGGMGVVLRAHDSDLHRSVAIKVLAPQWAASIPARQRFAREAQAAASVAHENVIPIYNVESDAALPYLVMRYVPGMTLQRWVTSNGPPDIATILRVAGQLAEGLAAAHRRGLVHRDIKPGNVMVGENIQRIWLTDFGLARAADSVTLTQTGIIAGTPNYMSPEQARGENVDQQSDLFSLGCLLYFLSTGRPPFESDNTLAVLHRIVSENAESLTTKRDDLPPAFVRLVHRLLHRQRSKRPADCQAVIEALNTAQSELDAGRTARKPMKKRTLRVLAAGVLVACIGVMVFLSSSFLNRQGSNQPGFFKGPEISLQRTDGSIARSPMLRSQPNDPVSPYLKQAAIQIEYASWLDTQQMQRRVQEIDALVDQLSRADPLIAVPRANLDDARWNREVNRLQKLINQSPK